MRMNAQPRPLPMPLMAHGVAKASVGGDDGYVMLEIPDLPGNVETADRVSHRLQGSRGEAVAVSFLATEPAWVAEKLDGTRWRYVILLQRLGVFAERSWDAPGPFDLTVNRRGGAKLEFVFRKVGYE